MNTYDPDAVYSALEDAAEEWTQTQYLANIMEKMGEILLAKMMLEAKDIGCPISLCKERARIRPEWETHIKGELEARAKADRARAKYKNTQALADARRTQESTMRTLTR